MLHYILARKELTKLFNEKFNTDKSVLAIKSYCNNRGFNSSNDGKFTSESIHWQKGLSKEEFKSHYSEESFKRMTRNACISNRRKKPGDEVVKNGEVFVIVSDDISIPYVKKRVSNEGSFGNSILDQSLKLIWLYIWTVIS